MIAALCIIVGLVMAAFGIFALVGANEAVDDLRQQRDSARATVRELLAVNATLHAAAARESTPLFDQVAGESPALDTLAAWEASREDWGVVDGWGDGR